MASRNHARASTPSSTSPEPPAPPPAPPQASTTIQNLRTLAQTHLVDLEAEDLNLRAKETTTALELAKYTKTRRGKDRPSKSSHSPTTDTAAGATPPPPPDTKGARLRSARDVLDRLRHDPSLRLSEYRVGYLERFEGIREMPVSSWISESTDEDWIPLHRVKYVKRVLGGGCDGDGEAVEEIVWDREARIDKVFGSGS